MTTAAPQESKRKPWWLIAVTILVVGGIVAAAMAMTADDDDSGPGGPSSGSIGDPEIRQAKWKITIERGAGKRLSKKQRASLRTQRKKLRAMTHDVFDALFLSPEEQGKALKANFTSNARMSYRRTGAGVPKGADDVHIWRRSAWIVIDQTSRATMSVRINARGQADEGAFATEHRSVLYVARGKGGWKVFAYEVDQKPFKKSKASDKDEKKKNEKRGKSSKTNKKDKKRSGDRNQRGDRS